MKNFLLVTLLITSTLLTGACSEHSFTETSTLEGEGIMGGLPMKEHRNLTIRQTTVMLVDKTSSDPTFCSGTIVASNLILTAAHCKPNNLKDLSISFADSFEKTRTSKSRKATAFIIHPYYTGYTTDSNDIALVQFEGGLPSGFKVRALPEDKNYPTNVLYWVAGVGWDFYREGLGTMRFAILTSDSLVSWNERHIALDQSNGKGICSGDSGGPLYIFGEGTDFKHVLVGVTSFVSNRSQICATSGFVAIRQHLPWLKKTIRKLRPTPAAAPASSPAPQPFR